MTVTNIWNFACKCMCLFFLTCRGSFLCDIVPQNIYDSRILTPHDS